jgi:hypothetical protein
MSDWKSECVRSAMISLPSSKPDDVEEDVEERGSTPPSARRDEDIALDLMKFVAVTTGYGRTSTSAAGFQSAGESKAEDYARHLLDLYGQCLAAVQARK